MWIDLTVSYQAEYQFALAIEIKLSANEIPNTIISTLFIQQYQSKTLYSQ